MGQSWITDGLFLITHSYLRGIIVISMLRFVRAFKRSNTFSSTFTRAMIVHNWLSNRHQERAKLMRSKCFRMLGGCQNLRQCGEYLVSHSARYIHQFVRYGYIAQMNKQLDLQITKTFMILQLMKMHKRRYSHNFLRRTKLTQKQGGTFTKNSQSISHGTRLLRNGRHDNEELKWAELSRLTRRMVIDIIYACSLTMSQVQLHLPIF